MTRDQAIELYLSKTKRASSIVKRIQDWDETKSMADNIKNKNCIYGYSQAMAFANRFGLKFLKKRKNGKITNREGIEKMLKAGLKQVEIAQLLNISRQRVEQILHIKDTKCSSTNTQ